MTGRRPPRRGTPGDQGFAIVLSAMLLLGLALTAYVTYQATVVPVMEAEAESKHGRLVADRFLELKSDLDRQVNNRSTTPALTAIPLGAERASLFSGFPTTGSLVFEPGGRTVDLWSNKISVQTSNATSTLGHPENWLGMDEGVTEIEDVASVVSFRLKLEAVSRDYEGDHVVVTVTDADGVFAGDARVCVARHPPDWDVHVRIKDADGAIVHSGADAYHSTQSYAPYWIDLLENEYRFDRVLAATKAPFDLALTVEHDVGEVDQCPGEGATGTGGDDLDASFAITYFQQAGDDVILRGGGGVVHEDHRETYTGGALRYTAEGPALGKRSVVLENGAVLLDQADGAVFRARPVFSAGLVDSAVRLVIGLSSLTGESGSVSGPGTAPVATLPNSARQFTGEASNLTLRVKTQHADLWAGLWRDELAGIGLTEGSHFVIATDGTSATLDVWGVIDPAPASESFDVHVRVVRVPVKVTLEG